MYTNLDTHVSRIVRSMHMGPRQLICSPHTSKHFGHVCVRMCTHPSVPVACWKSGKSNATGEIGK